VLDRSREHIRDRLDAAMRMPRKARTIVVRPLVAEIVEQQKRIELGGVTEPERALQADAGALDGRPGVDHTFDRSNGHRDGLPPASFRSSSVTATIPIGTPRGPLRVHRSWRPPCSRQRADSTQTIAVI